MNWFRRDVLVNWKTTTSGIAAAIIGFVVTILMAAQYLLDGNPDTNPDWEVVVPAVIGLIQLVMGLFARDADKSSQDSGVRK